jgi:hypothetical protein
LHDSLYSFYSLSIAGNEGIASPANSSARPGNALPRGTFASVTLFVALSWMSIILACSSMSGEDNYELEEWEDRFGHAQTGPLILLAH